MKKYARLARDPKAGCTWLLYDVDSLNVNKSLGVYRLRTNLVQARFYLPRIRFIVDAGRENFR